MPGPAHKSECQKIKEKSWKELAGASDPSNNVMSNFIQSAQRAALSQSRDVDPNFIANVTIGRRPL